MTELDPDAGKTDQHRSYDQAEQDQSVVTKECRMCIIGLWHTIY